MNKYYGDKEIVDIKDHPVHPDTHQILTFKDGTEKTLSKKMIGAAVTDEAVDLNKLRDLRCFPVVGDILKVFLDWDIHMSEIDFTNLRVTMSINESLKKANEVLWGVDSVNQSMLDVHDVLLKDSKEVLSPIQREDLSGGSPA